VLDGYPLTTPRTVLDEHVQEFKNDVQEVLRSVEKCRLAKENAAKEAGYKELPNDPPDQVLTWTVLRQVLNSDTPHDLAAKAGRLRWDKKEPTKSIKQSIRDFCKYVDFPIRPETERPGRPPKKA